MTVGQKIKLAYKGNKTVRELLVRDTNKIVGVAVVKSGRITDREVMTIATDGTRAGHRWCYQVEILVAGCAPADFHGDR